MNIVRELRKKAGIQQKELALEIGVSNASVSDWENGKKDPTGERLEKLADFFGVEKSEILGQGRYDARDMFKPADPKIVGVTETEQIVQYVLNKLDSKTPEIKIVSGMMEKMTKAQQEQVVAVVRAMFASHPEILEEKGEPNDSRL
jgi:transcriptional regulator with XRE-family HTH domain